MKYFPNQNGGFHPQSNIPLKIMVPEKLDNQLNFALSKPNRIHLKNNDKKQENFSLFDSTYPDSLNNLTTTSQPPMIWFPESSDCNNQETKDSGLTDGYSNTFQLIAFLLSVLNIVSLLISNSNSNSNNNINNNNINDNSFNGNANDVNENNSNSEVNAMNIVPPGKKKRKKRSLEESFVSYDGISNQIHNRKKYQNETRSLSHKTLEATLLFRSLELWMNLHLVRKRNCVANVMCEGISNMVKEGHVNDAISDAKSIATMYAEVSGVAIVYYLPKIFKSSDWTVRKLIKARNDGLSQSDCQSLYPECDTKEQSKMSFTYWIMPWNPMGNVTLLFKFLNWAFKKKLALPN